MVILHIYKFKDYLDHKFQVTSGHSAYPQEDWPPFVFKIMRIFYLLLMLIYDWLIHNPTIGRHAYNFLKF